VDEPRPYHHGPIAAECPVACLLSVLSRSAWLPLTRTRGYLCEPPETVGDVLDLYAQDQLGDITGLGRRRIGEISTALILAGFDLGTWRHQKPGPSRQEQPKGNQRG
jgi:hypothetical protein